MDGCAVSRDWSKASSLPFLAPHVESLRATKAGRNHAGILVLEREAARYILTLQETRRQQGGRRRGVNRRYRCLTFVKNENESRSRILLTAHHPSLVFSCFTRLRYQCHLSRCRRSCVARASRDHLDEQAPCRPPPRSALCSGCENGGCVGVV
jgi:hypothetical protein